MRRRIAAAIIGVSALILLALGIPLAIAMHRLILSSEVTELQGTATRALVEINVPLDVAELEAIAEEPDAPPPFSIYDRSGRRIFGDGPVAADIQGVRALAGTPVSSTTGSIIVAMPITEDRTERVVGALWMTESLAGADHRSRLAWMIMATAVAGALGVGWFIANRLARRLAEPVTALAAAAARLGAGGTITQLPTSGFPEIDTLASALSNSSEQVHASLGRERRFSADVSHQLRTPLTSLRLRLEAATGHDDGRDAIRPALSDRDRVDRTVEHLLAFARDSLPAAAEVDIASAARHAVEKWQPEARRSGRTLVLGVAHPNVTTRGSMASVEQILDVLIDNALRHGVGDVRLTQRSITGGVALDVSDQGHGISLIESETIFRRGHGIGLGIGLDLARSLAEADGGRLMLTRHNPTTFSLILLHRSAPAEG